MNDEHPARPCAGLRVIDFGRRFGALPGMILADFGADVVKVEPPDGDPGRSMAAFRQWNRGKRSVVIDLSTDAGQAEARRLALGADVVIEDFRPGVAEQLSIGYDDLAPLAPGLVHLSISGFGRRGPYAHYKGYEGIVAAKCGQHVIQNGYRTEGLIYDAVWKCSFGASMLGLMGVLAALRARDAHGLGQQVEASLVQANFVFSYTGIRAATPELTSSLILAQGRDPHNDMPGYRIARCSDDQWIQSGSALARTFDNLMRALGIESWFSDPRFADGPGRLPPDAKADLLGMIDAAYRTRSLDDWIEVLDDHDAAYGLFRTTQEFMDHPQVVHNGHVVDVVDPVVGPAKQIGPLVRFRDRPWRWPGPAPALGADTKAILAEPGSRPRRAPTGAALPQGALAGVTVVDLSFFAAAPGGPGFLCELGARVIKVEPPQGDPYDRRHAGTGELFLRVNRGKERIGLDLRSAAGQRILHQLVAGADVVVHNFRPGVPERLGADFETLEQVNDRLVYLYAASFGSSGPDAHRPAFDPVISAMAGGEVLQAGSGNPPQQRQTTDHASMFAVAIGALLGVRERDRTGESQQVETTMLASAAYLFSDDFIRYEGKPDRMIPDAGQHGLHALYRLYRAAGEGWVFLACCRQDEWSRLCESTGRDDLAGDERFATADARSANDDALAGLLGELFRERDAETWERELQASDVPCVVATSTWRAYLFDPVNAGDQPDFTVSYDVPGVGTVDQSGAHVMLRGSPGSVGRPEDVGASTRTILRELGYTDDEVLELERTGVVTGGG